MTEIAKKDWIGMRLGSSDDLPDFNNTEVLWV